MRALEANACQRKYMIWCRSYVIWSLHQGTRRGAHRVRIGSAPGYGFKWSLITLSVKLSDNSKNSASSLITHHQRKSNGNDIGDDNNERRPQLHLCLSPRQSSGFAIPSRRSPMSYICLNHLLCLLAALSAKFLPCLPHARQQTQITTIIAIMAPWIQSHQQYRMRKVWLAV